MARERNQRTSSGSGSALCLYWWCCICQNLLHYPLKKAYFTLLPSSKQWLKIAFSVKSYNITNKSHFNHSFLYRQHIFWFNQSFKDTEKASFCSGLCFCDRSLSLLCQKTTLCSQMNYSKSSMPKTGSLCSSW